MMTIIACVVALVTLVLAFGQKERETAAGFRRWLWLLMGIGLIEMLLLPTWPQRILLYLVLLHIQLSIPPSAHERYLMQVLIVVGGYCALLPYVGETTAFIPAFLWMLVGLGVLTTLWVVVSLIQNYRIGRLQKFGHDLYRIPVKIGWWQYDIYEGGAIHNMCAGHLNNNFTQPLQAIFLAAGVGLAVEGSTLALYLLPVLAFPFAAFLWTQGTPGQWIVHLFVLGAIVAGYYWGYGITAIALGLAITVCVFLFVRHQRKALPGELWWDSGRFHEWYLVIWQWYRCKSALIFIIGGGIRSWVQASTDMGVLKANEKNNWTAPIFSNAHNEYIQQLFEYGVVGFVCLLWYVGSVLVKAYALSIGLFWVACMLASAAMMTFPWTFYHAVFLEVPLEDGRIKRTETRHGSALLVWLTFLVTLLVEG